MDYDYKQTVYLVISQKIMQKMKRARNFVFCFLFNYSISFYLDYLICLLKVYKNSYEYFAAQCG